MKSTQKLLPIRMRFPVKPNEQGKQEQSDAERQRGQLNHPSEAALGQQPIGHCSHGFASFHARSPWTTLAGVVPVSF
jgi:hypothetical protein